MYFKKCMLLLTVVLSTIALSACGESKKSTIAETTPTPTETTASTDELTPTAEPTVTPTEEPTDSTAETTADSTTDTTVTGDLSDDLYSFQFSLNGTVYTLPCTYSQFTNDSWSFEDIDGQTLEPGQYTLSNALINGDSRIMANLVNTGTDVLAMDKCNVGKVSIDNYQAEKGVKLILPKNIAVGSTYDDVIAAYGKPSDERETDPIKYMDYNLDTYSSVKIQINTKTNAIDSIEMENLIAKETSTSSKGNSPLPDVVKNYTAPTSTGKTWDSFDIKYGDSYYHIPAPISSFINNGWVMVSDGNEMVAAKDSLTGVELCKDNQVMSTSVRNYADSEQPVSNCFVTRLKFSEFETKVSIELPQGITENSNLEDISAAYGDPTDKSTSSSFEFYEYRNRYGSVDFSISKDTKKISTAEIYNDPRAPY
ncbi:hypothetical protein [Anaerocolumna sp. MB42-C2]|uniref:hypothetical protein n=1 Tax=Anaerocolumna sp. MB42-C2 TaxID=3070997 RepID=UPI0027DEEF30|nr:hypothetical protein [Anaerocolumna sp. MB42-C2]WMJ87474.1 hypothetical protein RBU59_26120 [Anaerocolumna sp. MB42-C2]